MQKLKIALLVIAATVMDLASYWTAVAVHESPARSAIEFWFILQGIWTFTGSIACIFTVVLLIYDI